MSRSLGPWKRFYVGNDEWKVFLAPAKHRFLRKDKHGGPYAGRCRFTPRHILLCDDLVEDVLYDTLVHEVLHVVLQGVVGDEGGLNEAAVSAIAPGLAAILGQLLEGWPEVA